MTSLPGFAAPGFASPATQLFTRYRFLNLFLSLSDMPLSCLNPGSMKHLNLFVTPGHPGLNRRDPPSVELVHAAFLPSISTSTNVEGKFRKVVLEYLVAGPRQSFHAQVD